MPWCWAGGSVNEAAAFPEHPRPPGYQPFGVPTGLYLLRDPYGTWMVSPCVVARPASLVWMVMSAHGCLLFDVAFDPIPFPVALFEVLDKTQCL